MEITADIKERIEKLEEKYAAMGQDMISYLDGLLYSKCLNYWDYLQVETLLSLQKPKTNFPDELIFITYHQLCELYFKLIMHEFAQIAHHEQLTVSFFTERMKRVNRYVENLVGSFEIMIEGMERDQFLKFRMALLPGSGFQSASYRKIEIQSTDYIQLVSAEKRESLREKTTSISDLYAFLYWRYGATETDTGKKTLTLVHFEEKYGALFVQLGEEWKEKNIYAKYRALEREAREDKELINALRKFDVHFNINWSLAHYRSVVKHMGGKDAMGTGGTNWQKFLPPKFQKVIFFPDLWSEKEREEWGKRWVEEVVT